MKLHVNRTCSHAILKSQTGMGSFHLSCECTLTYDVMILLGLDNYSQLELGNKPKISKEEGWYS